MKSSSAGRSKAPRRFRVDRSVERFGDVLLGGSPLRLIRFKAPSRVVVDEIGRADSDGEFELADVTDPTAKQVVDRLVGLGLLHPMPSRRRSADVTVVTPAYAVYGPDRFLPGSIVVDDGSNPPIVSASIRLAVNRGPAAARNAGLASVTTQLVAFVDGDVSVEDGWLDDLVGHFDDPAVALVAPRVRADTSHDRRSGRVFGRVLGSYEKMRSPLDLGSEPALVVPGGRVSYVPATAIVCRADAVRAVGGFDESMRYGEDVDLVWRLHEAGYRVRYEPTVVVKHPARSTWLGWWTQRVDYGGSSAALAARHGDAVAPARLNRWSLLVWVAALGGRRSRVAAIAIALASAAAFPRRVRSLPWHRATRLALVGSWRAGDQLAQAVRRAWWPLLLASAPVSRRARRALAISILVSRSPIGVVDDLAYSIGVWKGCVSQRSLKAMAPKIS